MTTLTKIEARALIEGALASLLDPGQPAEALARFFTPDYVQNVDGKQLDYKGFIDHARALKKTLRSGRATIRNLIVEGGTIADIHVVEATKTDGSRIRAQVIAFYAVKDGRIARVDELTHLLEGSREDRDLGSRT
jgi:ketosteroid isomerase-like protein